MVKRRSRDKKKNVSRHVLRCMVPNERIHAHGILLLL